MVALLGGASPVLAREAASEGGAPAQAKTASTTAAPARQASDRKAAATAPAPSLTPEVSSAVRHDTSPALSTLEPVRSARPGAETTVLPRPVVRHPQAKAAAKAGSSALQTRALADALPSFDRNFEGVGNVNAVLPPDTQGDVGPNHYVQMINLSFAIYNKQGTLLFGPAPNGTLWQGFGGVCETFNEGEGGGDPITIYDEAADRWFMSQLAYPGGAQGYHACIAVSATPNPLGAYHRYDFLYSPNLLNDYPKFGIWRDAYYMTANDFLNGATFSGVGVQAYEREAMLAGEAADVVTFHFGSSNGIYSSLLPADAEGQALGFHPPPGAPAPFVMFDDDSFGFSPTDRILMWDFQVDWTNPENATFGIGPNHEPNRFLETAPFDSNLCNYARSCIPQPGTTVGLDAFGDRLLHRAAYRSFGTNRGLVLNHAVDVGPPNDHAGLRWYQLSHTDAGGWSIAQQGTFAPDADNRWMGSAALDTSGNLAIGYSVSSSTLFPSIRVAGRLAGDPAGELSQGEATMTVGGGSQTHTASRWGDYASMQIDPIDGCTFWFTTEYLQQTSTADWHTRIGSFRYPSPSCQPAPHGDLTGTVTDSVTNQPIAGAVVSTPTASVTTNAQGQYLMTLPVGTYDVTASARAYEDQTATGVVITENGTTTQNFSLTGLPILEHEDTLAFDGDGDGTIEPGESFELDEVIRNTGVAPATGITSVLTSQTDGLTITQASSVYPAISPGATGTNATRFAAQVAGTVPCGAPLALQLALTTDQGPFTVDIELVTCEFSQTGAIQIPDIGPATPYPSTINVSGIGTNITDVDLVLNGITHTEPDDIDILLVGPTGQTAIVMSDVGGTTDVTSPVTLTLDDQAPASMANAGPLVSGTFRPTQVTAGDSFAAPAPAPSGNVYLGAFNGTNPTGTWSLYVVDDLATDTGEIAGGWSLIITTGEPPPPPDPCPTDCTNEGTILVPDGPATPYPSSITYQGDPGAAITDVNLQLHGITHTFADDLDLMLVGPTGQTAIVMSDVGGGTDVSGVTLTLDDQAAGSIPDGGPLVSGTFRPSNAGATPDPFPAPAPAASGNVYLGAFTGTNPNGIWRLYAADDAGGDWGEITGGWSLSITTGTPPPPPDPCPTDCTNEGTILIPDGPATPYPSSITYEGDPGAAITDVNLQLHDITHTEPDDLDLLLVGPTGHSAKVVSDVGGTTDASNVTLTLDDQAPGSIPDAGPLASGTFKPTNADATTDDFPAPAPASGNVYLSAFNGTNPNGTWSLFVADDGLGEWGEITGGWTLSIVTGDPPPPPDPCPTDCTNEGTIRIPDGQATPYPSTITYQGAPDAAITDVNLQLHDLIHTEADDLDLLLVGPTGQTAIVMSDVGGTTDITTGVTLTLDDQAASHLPDSAVLTTGTFKPTNVGAGDTFPAPAPAPSGNVYLSAFNGTNPNGTWRLYVADDLSTDWGEITGGWSLSIETGAPPPPLPPCPPDCVNPTPIQIPDGPATPYPSGITYAGPSGLTITDLNLTLTGLTHTEPDDLDLLLVGPTGLDATVMSDAGGTTDVTGVTLTIDDQADTALPDSTVLTTGSFKPTNHGGADTWPAPAPTATGNVFLNAFNGTNPVGTWNLYVVDDLSGDFGEFTGGWSLTITTPPPTLAIDDVSKAEGDAGTTEFTFTVTKTGVTALPVSVDFATADGTATAPDDYAAQSGSLTIGPTETSKQVTILVNGDTALEPNETFTVNLTNPSGATIADGEGVGTIVNDDLPSLSIDDVSKSEGSAGTTAFAFTVTRTGTAAPASVDFGTADGTATAPSDYSAQSDTLNFAAGQSTRTITVLVDGDVTAEPDETFLVRLSNPRGATIADGEGLGTIVNDDSPSLRINDVSHAEGTTSFTFTVTKAGATGQPASVDFATANGTATAPGDYAAQSGTLSFGPTETSKQVTVIVNGDGVFETDETFSVRLANPSGATIADNEGVGTIENDDAAPSLVIGNVRKYEGDAGTTVFAFTVSKSGATELGASVDLDTADGTATTPDDYSMRSDTLSFGPGRSTRTITVLVDGETVREPDETFLVNLSNASGATIADGQGVGTIVNDDPRRGVVPNVKGKTLVQARRLLTSRRFKLGRIKRVYSSKVRKGRIISQSRRPGVRLPRGTRVNLVVSRGKRRAKTK